MKSPFPGMDPYLESYWSDVHTRLMVIFSNQLQRQLPEGLRARVEESIRVDDGEEEKRYATDIAVTSNAQWDGSFQLEDSSLAVAEPVILTGAPSKERYIEVVTTKGGHVVTRIEVISPANKVEVEFLGRDKFVKKRDKLVSSGINFVEIDLLRGGSPIPPAIDEEFDGYELKTYLIRVFRALWDRWEIYPLDLKEVLPVFRVPLRPSDKDVVLNLQTAIETCYEDGAYGEELEYQQPPVPAFSECEEEWAAGLIGGGA